MSGSDDSIDNVPPWDFEVTKLQKNHNALLSTARDLIIFKWLFVAGDPGPFSYWVLRGQHVPSPEVLKLLAVMLSPGRFHDLSTNYWFQRRGPPGAPPELNVQTRDELIGEMVSELMERDGPGTYDASITEVASWDGLSRSTVIAAYKLWKKKQESKP